MRGRFVGNPVDRFSGDEAHNFNILSSLSEQTSFNICLFGLMFKVPVNSNGHVGTVSSPNHTFFVGKLDSTLCTF